MPKGQSPRAGSFAKLKLLDKKLSKATDTPTLRKVKNLLKAYTTGYSSDRPASETKKIKEIEAKIRKRADSLLKNAP